MTAKGIMYIILLSYNYTSNKASSSSLLSQLHVEYKTQQNGFSFFFCHLKEQPQNYHDNFCFLEHVQSVFDTD